MVISELQNLNFEYEEINLDDFLDNFKRIYLHSKEFISIGSELSINQGAKATLENVYNLSKKSINSVSNKDNFLSADDSIIKSR